MARKHNARTACVSILLRLHQQQGSLASEMNHFARDLDDNDKRLTQELCYGVCRWYFLLENQVARYLKKPLKAKDIDIHCLIIVGLYQLQFTRIAPHAAINETVDGALFFRKQWAKKLINGVLRSFQRDQQATSDDNTELTPISLSAKQHRRAHPRWLQQAIKQAWPDEAKEIFVANNQHPPLTLRVNQQHKSVDHYLNDLHTVEGVDAQPTQHSIQGITLAKATDITQLPGFAEGHFSVQDEAAQFSAELLQLAPGQRVLDACCAPGGKTCHIGEAEPQLASLVALDLEERRLARVRDNIQRLSIAATVVCGDGTQPDAWWDGQLFDRILLDAPCSATGVIRRHPDIKLLRTPEAVRDLVALQAQLLNALWPLLSDGGILVYATCSILPEENRLQIEQFLANHSDAIHDDIQASWGIEQAYGRQLFPQSGGHDGFYYARLVKQSRSSMK